MLEGGGGGPVHQEHLHLSIEEVDGEEGAEEGEQVAQGALVLQHGTVHFFL